MKRSIMVRIGLCLLLLCLISASGVWGQDSTSRLSPLTHLNGTSRQIVNLRTVNLPNNNTSQSFFYDRQLDAPFSVPEGFSFVITDIFVLSQTRTFELLTGQFLVVVTIGGARSFDVQFIGTSQYTHLTAGLVVPEGASLGARNTTLSVGDVEVQLLGYFVRGPGLGVGVPFTFPDH